MRAMEQDYPSYPRLRLFPPHRVLLTAVAITFGISSSRASVIPPYVVSTDTTLIQRTLATSPVPAGTSIIQVQDDGFIAGADLWVDGEAAEVAEAGLGYIRLSRP